MQLKKTTEYAIRVLTFLRTYPGIHKLEEIARKTEIPEGYLMKVLQALKAHKVIDACQGSKGGYQLYGSAKELSLYEIMSFTEKTMKIHSCVEEEESLQSGKNPLSGTYKIYKELQELLEDKLKGITLDELAANVEKMGSWPPEEDTNDGEDSVSLGVAD